MATLKVTAPKNPLWVKADGVKGPAGNTDPCARVSAERHPGVSDRDELHNVFLR